MKYGPHFRDLFMVILECVNAATRESGQRKYEPFQVKIVKVNLEALPRFPIIDALWKGYPLASHQASHGVVTHRVILD
jgi:hypothetical protein